ncbi:MAG: tRNA 2-thiouridine(34) synthase MnmA [Anaerolineales bacterium]
MDKSEIRVVVAMSGGVDSSVAAALLKAEGYSVVGVMLRIWGEPDGPSSAYNRCCSPDSIAQARRVAEILDIPFYVLDAQATFKTHVVDFFVDSYVSGVTPNPCLECNRYIRWDYLLKRALAMDARYLATGHYARIRDVPDPAAPESTAYQLLKGVDDSKDQSYVLSVMGQAQLAHALFPIGEHHKPAIRQMARDFKLPVAEREESQDLCFLADDDYRRFVRERAGRPIPPGPIVRRDGSVVGEHTGLPFYTIGQRKGIGVAGPLPLYVLGTQPANNALVVGTVDELGQDRLTAGRVNWTSGRAPAGPFRAEVKIRYRAAPAWAEVTPLPSGRAQVAFDQPLRDITPGQAAVFYAGELCLGGGVIERGEA